MTSSYMGYPPHTHTKVVTCIRVICKIILSIIITVKMSEKLHLRWNEFQNSISETFGKLRADTDYSDVTLACGDGEHIEVHRLVLAASSNFFQKLFGTMKHPHPLVYLRGLKSEDLLAIIDFVYFGEAKICQENLENFLSIGNEFQLKGLMNQIDDGVQGFETEKEPTVKPVTNSENTQWIQETEHIQKSSKTVFETEKELPFESVTNSENTQWIEETEDSQKSSETGLEIAPVLSPLFSDIDSEVRSMMEKKQKSCKL